MTEVVRKGIQEAQVQLQKANEERLLEEVRLGSRLAGGVGGVRPGAGRRDTHERWFCSAGGAAADPCRGIRTQLVFSGTSFTEGKNLQLNGR